MEDDQALKLNEVAKEILVFVRNTLSVELKFMDTALAMLTFKEDDKSTLATDGRSIIYNPLIIIKMFKRGENATTRNYLHLILHCIFRHMFIDSLIDKEYWNLACDIAVEYTISEMNLKSTRVSKQKDQSLIFEELIKAGVIPTAERVYRYYYDNPLNYEELDRYQKLFGEDDHSCWYQKQKNKPTPEAEIESEDNQDEGSDSDEDDEPNKSMKNKDRNSRSKGSKNGKNDNDIKQAEQKEDQEGKPESKEGSGKKGKSKGSDPQSNQDDDDSNEQSQYLDNSMDSLAEQWKDISEHIEMDMKTFSKDRGDVAGGMMQNLKEVNREKYDYSKFLLKFATINEVMRINDDEFDYIFYTYGLSLFKNVPLIEPLEYKDVKTIKEFVIAIDTSGSTSGDLVQKFLNKTYNILKTTESFTTKVNIHIIQCDAAIQEDAKITNKKEFDKYISEMHILGLGGTDFVPVFEYVDALIKKKEFTNLKGLIYFTDGKGRYPINKPPYNTAFVFIDDNYNNYEVPPWAIKLILKSEEI